MRRPSEGGCAAALEGKRQGAKGEKTTRGSEKTCAALQCQVQAAGTSSAHAAAASLERQLGVSGRLRSDAENGELKFAAAR
jgi:hypothetical protein